MSNQTYEDLSNIIPYNDMTSLFTNASTIVLTDEELIEYNKCRDDIQYFCKYVEVQSLDHGRVKYKPYPHQKRITDGVNSNKLTIVLAPRQYGKTTSIQVDILHNFIFNKNYKVFVGADTVPNAKRILNDIVTMYKILPTWLKWGVERLNETYFIIGVRDGKHAFSNSIEVGATNKGGGRGRAYNYAYWDEVDYCENQANFYASIFSTTSSGKNSKLVLTSTPDGYKLFYELWTGALNNENGYFPIRVYWEEHPERDENFLNDTIKKLGKKRAMVDVCCEFAGSGDTLFDIDDTIALNKYIKEPVEICRKTSTRIYEKCDNSQPHLITIDLSAGNGKNYSVANVFKMGDYKAQQVAILRTNDTKSKEFANKIKLLQEMYNDAHVLYEKNGLGQFFDSVLESAGVNNVLGLTNKLKLITKRNNRGFTSNNELKTCACDDIVNKFNDKIKLVDEQTIAELRSLEQKSSAFSKPVGGYDDCADTVMQIALVLRATNYDSYFYIGMNNNNKEEIAKHRLNTFISSNKNINNNNF